MINVDLAVARGMTKSQLKDLSALHVAMMALVEQVKWETGVEPYEKWQKKELRRAVRRLEYQMQDIWGFERNKDKHTHWKRFDCLNPTEKM